MPVFVLRCLPGLIALASVLPGSESPITFKDQRPLLDAQCFSCHGQAKK